MTATEHAGANILGSPVIGDYVQALLERFEGLDDGEVARYIPELSHADPSLFGICITTVDGAVYEAGATGSPFTIQSISKPLTFGIALDLLGEELVSRSVGVEPSGEAFNEISLARDTGRPANPLINAGAIACAGLIDLHAPDPAALILDTYSRYAGRALAIDGDVYRSESETGHRNRAIAHLLGSFGIVGDEPEHALDLYFRQCSVSVTCRDLALIAATLAGGGMNPHTGERAVGGETSRRVLSVMATCGMYDGAGEWLVSVGLPAKSGVSGGVLAVLPGRLGIAVFSPRLDARGNSARGVAVCRELSKSLGLHLVRPGERPPAAIRSAHRLADRPSKRVRGADERSSIELAADRAVAYELQGELDFSAVETLARTVRAGSGPTELVVVDLERVLRVDQIGAELLASIGRRLEAVGGRLFVARSHPLAELDAIDGSAVRFSDLDLALESCEEALLATLSAHVPTEPVPIEQHELLAGLTSSELELVVPRLGRVTARPGDPLALAGEQADKLFLVTDGTLSVTATGGKRLATLAAGMTFGELPYLQGMPRTADVKADSDVRCRTLAYDVLHAIQIEDPTVYAKLIRNLLALAVRRLLAATSDAEALVR